MEWSDDSQLLTALKTGSRQAYEIIFKKYYKVLLQHAYYFLKDDMEAEDLVQNLFVELWDKNLYQQINGSVKAYLYRAVHNKCLNLISKQKTEQKRLNSFIDETFEESIMHLPETVELDPQIQMAVNELPAQRFEAFSLVYMEDKKYREAAEQMGISVNSVKTHLKLALKTLRQKIVKFK